ncbi:MAG TPA: hypothetical protein VHJ19_13305, partial [Gammaproteobacteria bacterium]|nr:hypothetical protein [Gammaproteobacteria bacterium]
MTGPEKKVQEAVCKYAKGLGYLIKRSYFGPGVEAGWPDTEIYMPYGYTLHIEFKAPGKPASKLQKKRIRDLRERGHMAI